MPLRRRGARLLAALLLLACALALGVDAKSSSSDSSSSSSPHLSNSTLVTVQVISRHGTRAPNPVVDKLCPADRANLALYSSLRITLAGLTGTGMREMYALGVFARQQYMERTNRGFISSYFNDQEVYFRAVGEDRTIQSAVAMAQGMYPSGSAPVGYSPKLASPVPVYTLPNDIDSLLEVRKQGCKEQLARDAARWDRTEGIRLYKANQALLEQIHSLCNVSDLNDVIPSAGADYNYGDAIKDITDAWTFDMIEGFKMQPGLNESSLLEFRRLAVSQLLGRIVGTDAQVTYMNGALPERMLDNFLYAVWNQGPTRDPEHALKMYLYHGHREMTYALAAMLGMEFDIQFPALPRGAIPPATTLFFELHYVGPRDANGSIPNAFEAAGVENPYEDGEGHKVVKVDSMEEKPMPWERRSASQTVHGHPGHAYAWNTPGKGQTPPRSPAAASTVVAVEQGDAPLKSKEDVARPGSFGGDQLSKGHGIRFQLPKHTPNDTTDAEESDDPNRFRYLPHAPSKSSSPPHFPEKETLKPPAAEWRPAPPMDGYVVRVLLWHPCGDADGKEAKEGKRSTHRHEKNNDGDPRTPDCPAVPLAMRSVCTAPAEEGCTLAQFSKAIHERIERTGTWDQLCGVKDPRRVMADAKGVSSAAKAAAASAAGLVGPAAAAGAVVAPAPSQSHPLLRFFLLLLLLVPLAGLCYLGFVKYRQLEYEQPLRSSVDPADREMLEHDHDHVLGFHANGDEESRPLNQGRVY